MGIFTLNLFDDDEISSSVSFFERDYTAPLNLVEKISKTPRFYQANTANAVATYLEQGWKRICVKSPTGTGKTLITKLIALSTRIRKVLNVKDGQKLRVLYVCHKHRLLRQAMAEYAENDSIELITQSAMSKIPQDVIDNGFDLTILDESHHECMMSIQKLLDSLTHVPLIGFTADDSRGDGLLLKFERFHVAISEYQAAKLGFTEKVGINSIIDLGKLDKTYITCRVLEKYHKHMGNTIIFLKTEKECQNVTRFLKRMNLKAYFLNSTKSESDMDKALDKLSKGDIQFLVNCKKISEGIDAPNITDVFLARNFNSAAEKKQFIGRGIRTDSPCGVWELVNPIIENVVAKQVVGLTKYERLLSISNNEWTEQLLSGEDLTWGKMSEIRNKPINKTIPTLDDYSQKIIAA